MPYVKKHCYVVYGTYKDDPEYPIGAERKSVLVRVKLWKRLTRCVRTSALKM